jgi:hypothetical protein
MAMVFAATPSMTLTSGTETLLGVLHLPAGPGPHQIGRDTVAPPEMHHWPVLDRRLS